MMCDFLVKNTEPPSGTLPITSRVIFNYVFDDFEKIPTFMRPSDDEIRMMLSNIYHDAYDETDYAILKFSQEHDLIPRLSILTIEIADISAQCGKYSIMDDYIFDDIRSILNGDMFYYVDIMIQSNENEHSCNVVVSDLSLRDTITFNHKTVGEIIDDLEHSLSKYSEVGQTLVLDNNFIRAPFSFLMHAKLNPSESLDLNGPGASPKSDRPVVIKNKDYDYDDAIIELVGSQHDGDIYKDRERMYILYLFDSDSTYYSLKTFLAHKFPFTGSEDARSVLTLNEFVKRDYFFQIHEVYEFLLIGNTLFIPKLSLKTFVYLKFLEYSDESNCLNVVLRSMEYLLADNASRELYCNRTGVSNITLDKIFRQRDNYINSVTKSYVKISKKARNPFLAFKRDILNQFRYNPAIFCITFFGLILASTGIIQVLQTANIIPPRS